MDSALSNIINIKSNNDLSSLWIVYNGSSSVEYYGFRGYSHICEHLICESLNDIFDDLQKDFIEWNAYTSPEQIVFHFKGFEDKLSFHKEEILKRILNLEFSQEVIEKEKNIIIQEYYDSTDSPFGNLLMNVHRKVFSDYMPIGSIEDIRSCTKPKIDEWLKTIFENPSSVVNVSKNLETNFEKKSFTEFDLSDRRPSNESDFIRIGESDDLYPILFLTNKISSYHYLSSFICDYFSDGLNSPLYKIFRYDENLCYSIQISRTSYNKDYYLLFGMTTSKANVDKVKEKFGFFISNIDDFLTEKRFDILKSNKILSDKKEDILRYSNAEKYFENPLYHVYSDEIQKLGYNKFKSIIKDIFSIGYEVYTPADFLTNS